MVSPHSPDRLATELQSTIGPPLSERGYRVVGAGSSGLIWRRDRPQWAWVLIIALCIWSVIFLINGISDLSPVALILGLVAAGLAFAAFKWRAPAMVTFHFRPGPAGGTEIIVEGADGRDLTSLIQSSLGATK